MGNNGFKYTSMLIITAIVAVLAFSAYAFMPSAAHAPTAVEFKAGSVLPGGTSNRTSTSIPVTTSTIPQTSASGNSAVAGAPKLKINITYVKAYTVELNGNVSPGTANTTITALNISWGDGVRVSNVILPINHTYSSTGTFTITAEAFQSNNETNTAVVSALVNNTSPGTATTVPTTTVAVNSSTVSSSVNTTTAAPTTVAQASSGSSGNTLLYVGIVVVVILILLAAYFLMRKK
jgi:hypothetical protein